MGLLGKAACGLDPEEDVSQLDSGYGEVVWKAAVPGGPQLLCTVRGPVVQHIADGSLLEGSFSKPPTGWVGVSPASVRDLLTRSGLTMTPEDEPVIHAMLLQMQANFSRPEGAPQVAPPNITQGRSVLRTPDSRRWEPTRFSVLALVSVSVLMGAGAAARGRAAA
jgi:hypothetical protein